MKNTILIPLLLLATACTSSAQTIEQPGSEQYQEFIVIDATGMAVASADRITFHITLNRFHEEAEIAFSQHKDLERFLTDLLLEKGIDDERIQANPVSISPRRYSNDQGYETRQRVSVELEDIAEFEQMQVDLIENGFDNFSGSFGSSEENSAREEAIKNAVREAQSKAGILAEAAGRNLGGVVRIEHTSTGSPVYRESADLAMSAMQGDGGMLQFQSTIPVRENVRITFRLSN